MKKQLLLLLMTLLPMMAWADAVEIDGIYYNLNTEAKTSEVKSSNNYNPDYYSGSVVIPEKVKYEGTEYNVTSIGDYAFSYCTSLLDIRRG